MTSTAYPFMTCECLMMDPSGKELSLRMTTMPAVDRGLLGCEDHAM